MSARHFISKVGNTSIPASVEAYAHHVGALIHYDDNLGSGEAGCTTIISGKHCILINGNDPVERQRFTICHEIGHIVLSLQTQHTDGMDIQSYTDKPKSEIYCDIFAAEILLPSNLFRPFLDDFPIGFETIDRLSGMFKASRTATGSRYAFAHREPCAFVLSERRTIRYASRSLPLRENRAWIPVGQPLPKESFSAKAHLSDGVGPIEIPAEEWFEDWCHGGYLLEDARYLQQWDQTLSLLWFQEGEEQEERNYFSDDEDKGRLQELDGILPWPGKKRRR